MLERESLLKSIISRAGDVQSKLKELEPKQQDSFKKKRKLRDTDEMIQEKQHHVKLIEKDISVRAEDIHNNVKDVERRDTLIQLKEQEIIDNEEELQYRELEEIREKNNLLIMRE